MAQVQTTDGVARVLADPTPPDNRIRLNVDPDAFGAGVARAKQKAGAVVQQIGQEGFALGEHFSRVQVDDQTTKWMQDANKHLDEFRLLEGQARLTARPRVEKAIEDAAKNFRDKLTLPMQQAEFDRQTRNFKQSYLAAQFSSLSQQADRSYRTEVAKRKLATAFNTAAFSINDPNAIEAAREQARHAQVNMLEAEGNDQDPDLYAAAIESADRGIDKSVTESIAVSNPRAALEYADKHAKSLGHEYVPLANALRTRLHEQDGFSVADQAFAGTAAELANPEAPRPSGIRQALYDQEGGPETNPTQIQKGTWEQWEKDGLVHQGEKFGDPEAMRAVSDRAIAKYEKEFAGDPDRVAVAWFSRPGNVAPAGAPQPFVEDRKDQNGKSVSSYVSDIRGRIGGPKGAMYEAQASVYDKILAATEGRPEIRRVALREASQRFSAARTAALQSEAAVKAATESAVKEYGTSIRNGQPGQPWRNDGRLSESQIRDLDAYQQQRLKAQLEGEPGNFGNGYDQVRQRIMGVGPDRILHEQQLLPLLRSGDINVAGYDAASKLLERFKKPGAVGERVQEEAFWAAAKKAVTIDQGEIAGANIPVSTERLKLWSEAIPMLSRAIEAGRASGVPDDDLFDANNPKSAWRALGQPGGKFLPSSQQATNVALRAAVAKDAAPAPSTRGMRTLEGVETVEDALRAWKENPDIPDDEFRRFYERKFGKPTGVAPQVPNGGFDAPGEFDTKLSPDEEAKYQDWKRQNAPNDSGADYDLRGAFKAGLAADNERGHFPDTFKKPNHPTFSKESRYSNEKTPGGRWENRNGKVTFVPSKHNLKNMTEKQLREYFAKREPDADLDFTEALK